MNKATFRKAFVTARTNEFSASLLDTGLELAALGFVKASRNVIDTLAVRCAIQSNKNAFYNGMHPCRMPI